MFNYLIHFQKTIRENLPEFFHNSRRLNWVLSMIRPVKIIHSEFRISQSEAIYKVAYTGQKIYLERILNERFDPILRRIYITNDYLFNDYYVYKIIESKPPKYLYKMWLSTTNYVTGNFVIDNNSVYRALASSTNEAPLTHPMKWQYVKPVTFLHENIEYSAAAGFIVHVPSGLVFDNAFMVATVEYYIIAGINFTIVTF